MIIIFAPRDRWRHRHRLRVSVRLVVHKSAWSVARTNTSRWLVISISRQGSLISIRRGFRLVRRVDCHIFSRSHTPILLLDKDSAAHVTHQPPPRSCLSQLLSFPACSLGDRCRAADFGRKQQKRILWDGRADQAEFHVERVLDHGND